MCKSKQTKIPDKLGRNFIAEKSVEKLGLLKEDCPQKTVPEFCKTHVDRPVDLGEYAFTR